MIARDVRGAEMHGKSRARCSAQCSSTRRRVARACAGSSQNREFQCGGVNLQRMMEGVAAEQRAFSRSGKLEDDVAGRVPGRGLDQHRVVDRVRAVEQHGLAGLDHRQHAVAIGAAALRVGVRRRVATRIAVFVLGAGEQVPGVRKVGTQRPSRSIVFQPT